MRNRLVSVAVALFAVTAAASAADAANPKPAPKATVVKPATIKPTPMTLSQGLLDKLAEAFNAGDAKALAALCSDDATLINPAGVAGHGKAEVEKVAAADMATIVKGTQSKISVESVHLISAKAWFVDATHNVTGAKKPDGTDAGPMAFHVVFLIQQVGKDWKISEARPYLFLAPPAH